VNLTGGVEEFPIGVHDACKRSKEDEEGDDDHIEEGLDGEDVGKLGVSDGEGNGHGQVDPGLEEGDDLSTRARGSDDQDVLLWKSGKRVMDGPN
jgi:hypothetical protein